MTNESLVFRSIGLSELEGVAEEIVSHVEACKIWLLYGEVGAGKTTLMKVIGAKLGVTAVISSPTFSIINEYETSGGDSIYHFDFYRIKNEREAYDIGTDEYLYSGRPCFIEWPEKILSLIPQQHGRIEIESNSNTARTIVISVHDGKEENGI